MTSTGCSCKNMDEVAVGNIMEIVRLLANILDIFNVQLVLNTLGNMYFCNVVYYSSAQLAVLSRFRAF